MILFYISQTAYCELTILLNVFLKAICKAVEDTEQLIVI
jgi:hypothetical protein